MTRAMKRFLSCFPFFYRLFYKVLYRTRPKQLTWKAQSVGEQPSKVFTEIFEKNLWGSDESVSGLGSTLEWSAKMRKSLPELLLRRGARTLLDAPCGDFNWMRVVQLPEGLSYLGGDIVGSLISDLQGKYGRSGRQFVHLDILTDPLPDADLWLCRDALIHFPSEAVIRVLEKFAKSNTRYLLTTTFDFPTANPDIAFGDFRLINLRIPPFSLPKPLEYIDDYPSLAAPRRLGLWAREQLLDWNQEIRASAQR